MSKRPYAYKLIRRLNDELEGSGCMFIPGKVNERTSKRDSSSSPMERSMKTPVYRDKECRTWYESCIYRDFKGVRRHKTKRGFKTKAEAATYLRTVNNQLSAIFNHAVRNYGHPSGPLAKAGCLPPDIQAA